MKNQALFSSKNKTLKCCLLQFLFDTLRVKGREHIKKKEHWPYFKATANQASSVTLAMKAREKHTIISKF